MKAKFSIFLLFFFLVLYAQVKNDSIYTFQKFNTENHLYESFLEKKLKSENQIHHILDSLKQIGYFTLQLDSIKNQNVYLNTGKMYKKIWVKSDSIFVHKSEYFSVQNIDSLLQKASEKFANEGFPFTQFEIEPLGYINGELQVQLKLKKSPQRKINHVVVEGYSKLSKGYIKHGLGLKKGIIYKENELKTISEKIQSNNFIEEIKPPQTLFHTDSTSLYLYVKKNKSNLFDGVLGFGNDQNDEFKLTGNVKIELNNNFNSMEQIKLNWIATADKSSTLDLGVRVPYLFRSPIGTQTKLNLYRKDSTFVNLKLEERIFYQLTQHTNIGLNFSHENSNFVLDEHPELALLYDDYTKNGYGLSYEWIIPSKKRLLEAKSMFYILGKSLQKKGTEYDLNTLETLHHDAKQYEVGFTGFYIFSLGEKHLIKTKAEGFALLSNNDYFTENELYRIGGFNSIRGFNEESINASTYGIGSVEYRFMPNEGFYIGTFVDYGFMENKANQLHENLLGIGTGISFLTQLGIFNISYAVGKQSNTNLDFRNSKVHFGILTRF